MFRRTRRTGGGWLGLLSGAVCLVWVLASVQGIQAQPREVKIGVIYPMTGGAAQAGWDDKQAIELALDIINTTKYKHLNLPLAKSEGLDKLGGAKITVVIADHQGKPELGLSEAERLVTQEKVAALLGCYHSNVTMTASQVAERMKIPFLNPESSSPQLTRRGFKWFFRTTPHDENFSEAMFLFFKDLEKKKGAKIKTVAILHEDTLYGQDSGRIEKEMAEKAGYKVLDVLIDGVSAGSIQTGSASRQPQIRKVKGGCVPRPPFLLAPPSERREGKGMSKIIPGTAILEQ